MDSNSMWSPFLSDMSLFIAYQSLDPTYKSQEGGGLLGIPLITDQSLDPTYKSQGFLCGTISEEKKVEQFYLNKA